MAAIVYRNFASPKSNEEDEKNKKELEKIKEELKDAQSDKSILLALFEEVVEENEIMKLEVEKYKNHNREIKDAFMKMLTSYLDKDIELKVTDRIEAKKRTKAFMENIQKIINNN